jgi:hypothetical protein
VLKIYADTFLSTTQDPLVQRPLVGPGFIAVVFSEAAMDQLSKHLLEVI